MKKLFLTFIKFGIVGASGTVIDFVITALMMLALGMKAYISTSLDSLSSEELGAWAMTAILLSNFVGFVVSASSNFILNRIWTWKSTDPDVRRQYLKFFMVSLGGLAINLLVIFICNKLLTEGFVVMDILISRFWIAKVVATAVVMFWNFFVNHLYTFKESRQG